MAAVFTRRRSQPVGRRSNYTARQKTEIVLSVLTNQTTVAEACRRHAITETTFNRWREQAVEGMERGLADTSRRSPARTSTAGDASASPPASCAGGPTASRRAAGYKVNDGEAADPKLRHVSRRPVDHRVGRNPPRYVQPGCGLFGPFGAPSDSPIRASGSKMTTA